MEIEPHQFSRAVQNLVAGLRHLPEDRGRSRSRQAQTLGDAVEKLMTKYQIGRPSPEQTIRDNWSALVGPANAAYSNAVRIDRGKRLLVHASHAVVRSELFLHRAAIAERIRKLPGCEEIRDIFIKAG